MTQLAESFPKKCLYQAADTIDMQLLQRLGIPAGQLYERTEQIVALARALAEQRCSQVISLPFSHTVEAEALGAEIRPADDSGGPRPGKLKLTDPCQLPELELTAAPQVKRLLEACRILSGQGYQVAYQISGPISIFSCLMDLAAVFHLWLKQPQQMQQVLGRLQKMLLAYAAAACDSKAAYLSYADPAGNADILGPKFTRLLTEQFSAPLLEAAQELCAASSQTQLLLCPLTAAALAQNGRLAEAENGPVAVGCLKAGAGKSKLGFRVTGGSSSLPK